MIIETFLYVFHNNNVVGAQKNEVFHSNKGSSSGKVFVGKQFIPASVVDDG